MGLNQNTWKLNQWYDQDVAGNVSYTGAIEMFVLGRNQRGELGQNNQTDYSSPVQIPGTTWSNLGTNGRGYQSNAAIRSDGTLWVWGGNQVGELGQNNETSASSPVQIPGTDWSTVTTAFRRMTAIKSDGTMWSWGYGGTGALGQNNTTQYSSPVQIPGTWSDASVGSSGVHGIKTDGTLWGWGGSANGQLGNNNDANVSSPIQISYGPGSWSKISGGELSTFAIGTDGTLWAWGKNHHGQLAQNNRTERSVPYQVGTDSTWSEVGSGTYYSSNAIKSDGTMWQWGYNRDGNLGQNNTTSYSSPVQVPGTTWNHVDGGYQITGATKTDGTLWTWGRNEHGALGQNNLTDYSSPVQIPGTWKTGKEGLDVGYDIITALLEL